jgi:hypothetical protein
MRQDGGKCWKTRCSNRAARLPKRSAHGLMRSSRPTNRREFPENGRRRERHHLRRRRTDLRGPKRPPRAHTDRARDRAWLPYYNSSNGFGTGPSQPSQAGPPLPANSAALYGPCSAGRTGRDGCRSIIGTNRHGRHRRCPRRHLRAKGRAGRGNQRRRRSQANRSRVAVSARLTHRCPLLEEQSESERDLVGVSGRAFFWPPPVTRLQAPAV